MQYKGVSPRKFIIAEDGGLRIGGFCDFHPYLHKDLFYDNEKTCYGGGKCYFIRDEKLLVLSGESYDFGKPQFDKLVYFDGMLRGYKVIYQPIIGNSENEIEIDMSTIETLD